MKWLFLIAFGGVGLLITLTGIIWQPSAALVIFGLVFLLAGIGSYFGIGSMDKSFEKAFFMVDKFGSKSGRMKGFYKGEATVKTVDVADDQGEVFVTTTCELLEADTGIRRTFSSSPTTYKHNGRSLTAAQAQAWQGQKVWIVYNTTDPNDYYLDLGQLMGIPSRPLVL